MQTRQRGDFLREESKKYPGSPALAKNILQGEIEREMQIGNWNKIISRGKHSLTEKLNKQRKQHKKGFTLIELIVVIVILAILAAIAVPALTGYIDKAKNTQYTSMGRQALVAAQAAITDDYAKGKFGSMVDDANQNFYYSTSTSDDGFPAGTFFAVAYADKEWYKFNESKSEESYIQAYVTPNGQIIAFFMMFGDAEYGTELEIVSWNCDVEFGASAGDDGGGIACTYTAGSGYQHSTLTLGD
jgi:type IV pilus assembly protein PilA